VIIFSLVIAVTALTVFLVIVASIRRCERWQSLFRPSRGGPGDALTRRVLALHVQEPPARSRRAHPAMNYAKAVR
jgi:hypothetical protein